MPIDCRNVMLRLGITVVLGLASVLTEQTSRAETSPSESSVAQLSQLLQTGNLDERRQAAYELARRGSGAAEALPALVKGLSDDDEQVWSQSMTAVNRLGAAAAPAIDDLLSFLGHGNAQRRYRAAHTLARLGPAAVPGLQRALASDQPLIRESAAQALGSMSEQDARAAVPELLACLEDDVPVVRHAAAEALGQGGPALEADLRAKLTHPAPEVIEATLRALRDLPIQDAATVKLVESYVGHRAAGLRAVALAALSHATARPEHFATTVMRALEDNDPQVRDAGLAALVKLGPAGASVIPTLQSMLRSAEATQRNAAAYGFHVVGPLAPDVAADALLQALVALHDQDSQDYERNLIHAIQRLGSAAVAPVMELARQQRISAARLTACLVALGETAQPVVLAALQETQPDLRLAAVQTLAQLDIPAPEVVSAVAERLQDSEAPVRAAAAQALANYGHLAQLHADALRQAWHDPDPHVRGAVVAALCTISDKPHELLPLVQQGLTDEQAVVRQLAFTSIEKLSLPAAEQVTIYEQALKDSEPMLRRMGAEGLARVGSLPDHAQQALLDHLDDADAQVRAAVVAAVGELDMRHESVINQLSPRLHDADAAVVLATIQTLGKLGSAAQPLAAELAALRESPAADLRGAVAASLPRLHLPAEQSVDWLVPLLSDPEWKVRQSAIAGLGRLGPAGRAAVPHLFGLLESEVDGDAARSALQEIDDVLPTALPLLLEGAKSEHRRRRMMSIFFLGKLGSQATSALPTLRTLLDEKNPRLRDAAQRAIERIEGNKPAS